MKLRARIFALLFLMTAAAPAAFAEAPNETAIRDVITRQLDALDKGDQVAAFAIASPTIQQMFKDPPSFMAMVERGYPQVLHSRSHRFLSLTSDDGRLIQRVFIESDAGTVIGSYEMIQIDGVWRINGVAFEKMEAT